MKIFSDKTYNQDVIQKRLVGQLGERFEHAQLIELQRGAYLISNRVRLPVFGKKAPILERTDENMTREGFRAVKEAEHLAWSDAARGALGLHTNLAVSYKYVLDPVTSLVMKKQEASMQPQQVYGDNQ